MLVFFRFRDEPRSSRPEQEGHSPKADAQTDERNAVQAVLRDALGDWYERPVSHHLRQATTFPAAITAIRRYIDSHDRNLDRAEDSGTSPDTGSLLARYVAASIRMAGRALDELERVAADEHRRQLPLANGLSLPFRQVECTSNASADRGQTVRNEPRTVMPPGYSQLR